MLLKTWSKMIAVPPPHGCGASLAEFGPDLAECGPYLVVSGPMLAVSGLIFVASRPGLAGVGPMFVACGGMLVETRLESGQIWVEIGVVRPCQGRWVIST